ncbi:alanine--tRNA ligase [Candidatus Woesearchaeota archaeon]|nr:alanine--tRNA ligase [Candidatus Woesearchaeota archaeon]MBW3022460.1 alanine--tRNA ligase [Candidatus Woesearchaeota archaeon]
MKPLTAKELKKKYLDFFKKKKHAIIDSASIIPEHDPTVLFTTAGMHPLVPFLMGQPHPMGKRLANVQKCIRTVDIDNVGDQTHTTFFEMLGNWSLNDYFKKEAIEWSFEFLTKELGFDPEIISVTCFAGDDDAPKDQETADTWKSLGISGKRIYFLPKEDNWWGPAGATGPCGPCTEMFIDTGLQKCGPKCRPGCNCGKWFEIWNDVFMNYEKKADGSYVKMKRHNVDTGMGVERTIAMLQKKKSVYDTELFKPLVELLDKLTPPHYTSESKSMRIICDHIRASVFILGDERGVVPSNVDQGYILRRYIRRIIRHTKLIGVAKSEDITVKLAKLVIKMYKDDYPELKKNEKRILEELKKEEDKFERTLDNGLKEFEKMIKKDNQITAKEAFLLFQSYGFPIEMIEELAKEKDVPIDVEGFNKEYEKHQALSREGAAERFKGGLSEASEVTAKLHTATHLLNEALRKVLGKDIKQKGSNITPKRLRFDFNFDRKLTDEEKKAVEDEVNSVIKKALEVTREEMPLEKALKTGAQAEFGAKYPPKVTVYSVGDYSKEICMGPHVNNTKELGKFKIIKEESVAAGVRRIKAILE